MDEKGADVPVEIRALKEADMEKIASFTVNHLDLLTGIYVSRKDYIGKEVVTTFDLRMTRPNVEPVMGTAAVHALEHLCATFLRNHKEWGERVIYFGPMGCRTGFYLILKGDLDSRDVVNLITETFNFIANYEGEVPGASARDCGNYLDMNLPAAKYEANAFLENTLNQIEDKHLVYPN